MTSQHQQNRRPDRAGRQGGRPSAGAGTHTAADRQQTRRAIIGGAALIAVLLLIWVVKGGTPDAVEAPSAQSAPTQPPVQAGAEPAEAGVTPEPTPDPASLVVYDRAATRPTPTAPGFGTVYRQADTTEKIVAITVDDCFQAENLRKIVDKALEVGGKLTIFPIGQNVIREPQAQILKYAWENGFELENHTWSHNNLYRCSDEELAQEVYTQQLALSYILDAEYQCHFLRPMGGDARHDQRMQMYAEQMGYYGIAYWTYSASDAPNRSAIVKALEPGVIYLFHTTDKDTEVLMEFIPWLVEQGYTLVTMNEMFDYPANETSPLTAPVDKARIAACPTIAPYERILVPYKKTSYAWGVLLLQQRLKELGYLRGTPDGIYGASCEKAVKAFQKDHGLSATGVADVETQKLIFGL